VTEWLKVSDCKSVGLSLHRFESYLLQIMPQFDSITFFNQMFWLIFFFVFFYNWLILYLLPYLSFNLKYRNKLILQTVLPFVTKNLVFFFKLLNGVLKLVKKI
jgi:hypothetical protein